MPAKTKKMITAAFIRHLKLIKASQKLAPGIIKGAALIAESLKRGNKILICGNGGSAAQSQHFAAELVCRYRKERKSLPAIALTTDTSVLTAIGNDYGFDKIFSRQIESLGSVGDVLVVITTSGRSKNILRAIERAKKQKLVVIALIGQGGLALKKVADTAIIVPAEETARIQEVHDLVIHIWCEFIDAVLGVSRR